MDERLFHLGFSVFPGIGSATFHLLLNKFGSAKAAWNAAPSDLKVGRIGQRVLTEFTEFREKFSPASYAKILTSRKIVFIAQIDKEYPPKLLATIKPPIVLFAKGDLRVLKTEPSIGIVGTRKTTQYGREVTEMITGDLVNAGFTVVSGLALGVDSIAHKITVDALGKTIAVLGCGIDCCNPAENQNLYDSIIKKGGVIVSELPLSHPPTKGSFPSRNRIIAGLSDSVLVTEGAEDSGALITADYAIKFGRTVFAVPGPITSGMSKGPYKLISQGAKLVTSGEDIIRELNVRQKSITGIKSIKSIKGRTKEEQEILDLLKDEAMLFDEIVRKTKLSSQELGTILSILELRGIVQSNAGSYSIVYA